MRMYFDEVYKRHYQELKRFGHQLNLPSEKCEDLVQETFLKFYAELNQKVVFDNPRAWLYKVYLNLVRTGFRHNCHDTEITDHYTVENAADTDIHEEFARNERKQIVLNLLNLLSENDRHILILYNNGLSYREISAILDINPNSVGKTLVRAIELLKKTVKTHCNELFEQN